MRGLIVVGVAGSTSSRAALRWALRHAARSGGAVELLHVVPTASGPGAANGAIHLLTQAVRAASALAPTVAVSSRILRGDVVDSLAGATVSAAMLVVGSSSPRSRAPGRGSVSRAVATVATCPVVLVPNTDRRSASGVVLGAGGSDSGRAALRFAQSEAAATGQPLTIVRAWSGHPAGALEILAPSLHETARRAAERLLASLAAAVSRVHPLMTVGVRSTRGAVATVLVSASIGADLLVVGDTRARPGRRPGLGAVADAALDRMISPIAVVRSTEESARSEDARWDDAVSEGWADLEAARDVLPWSSEPIGAKVAE